ncbi:MAG: hypothetical protein IKB07_04490 [Lachnospiraceae bacterium]|nr:hypothetical protein [Lachnospiraceae bacterium]
MKKRLIAIISVAAVAIATVVSATVLLKKEYTEYLIVESDGVAVTVDEMLRNLTGDKIEDETDLTLSGETFSASDTIYERKGKLYLGENKVPLQAAYPFFVNNQSAVFCLTDSVIAVTEDFEYVSTYPGLYISNGISFNQDMERAYREDFLFLQLSNGLYMNTMDFSVKTSDLPGTLLIGNTVLSFFENEIRYYTPDGKGNFSFGRISGLNIDSKVQIDGTEYTYYDLLERLGLYEKEVLFEDVVVTTLTPPPTPTAKVNPKPTLTPTAHVTKTPPTPGVSEDGADEPGTGEGIAGELTPKPTPILPGGATPTPQTKPTKVPTDRERITATPKPTMTPIPAPTAAPAAPGGSAGTVVGGEPAPTAAPAEPAAPAAPAAPAPPKPAKPSDPEAMIWVKPTAELNGSFSALVYSITHNSLEVKNPQFLHKSGITFEVFDPATGKLVTRKAYGGSSNDIRISGLRPGTTYKVVVTLNYVDVRGNKQSEVLRAGDVITTLGTDSLPPISLNWSNGAYLYTNKAELVSIQIDNYNASNKFYLDMVQHIAKVEMNFSAKKSEESFKLDQKGLGKLKEQEAVDYTTPERLLSDREYTYTFVVTDKYGEAFRMEGTYSGRISTSKKAPTAKIKVIKNEVKDIELSIDITNEENAATENMYFLVRNSNGSVVETAIYRNGVYEAKKDAHLLPEKSTTIRFDELIDFEVYTVEVYSDYDLSDNHGMQINQEIGKTKVVTASITSLGQAFYNITIDPITAETATVSVQLNNERTNQKLAALIDEYDIGFVKVLRNENGTVTGTSSEGIVVQYVAKEDDSANDGGTDTLPEEQPETGDGSEDGTVSGDSTDTGILDADEGLGEDGEGVPDDSEPPVSSDILFTKENGSTTLYEYQLDGIHGPGIRFMLSGLDSMSEYRIQMTPKVHVGNEEYGVVREIRTNFSPNSFKTLKKTPFVRIGSAYVTGNRIRLFDLSVVDEDGAVLEYPLSVQVYDENGYPVFRKNFTAGEVADGNKVKEIVIEPLNRFQKYTFRFFVTRYNDVPDSADYSTNYELYYEPYVKTKELLVLETGEAVLGNLNFIGMNTYKVKNHSELEVLTGAKGTQNLFTPYAVKKSPTGKYITSTSDINKVSYTTNGTTAVPFKRYNPPQNTWSVVYKATIDFGTGEYNSMSVGYSHSSGGYPLAIKLYTEDPTVNASAVPVAETTLDGKGKTFNNYAIKWLDAAKFKDGAAPLTGEQTVYVEYVGTDKSNYAWIGAFSGVIFRNIEEVSSEENLYANISVDINDVRGQLGSMAAYRIKVYKDGILDDMQEHVYTSLNGVPEKAVYLYDILHEDGQAPQYLEAISYTADDKQCITDFFYEVDRNAAKGHVYEMVLTAIVDGYEITLDRITFESKNVVHGIRNREEFSLICWDTKASYVALNDIDFGTWHWAQTGLTSGVFFEGHLDFQGYKIITNHQYAPIYNIGTNGVVENVVVTHADSFVGYTTAVLTYNNYGTIRNVVYEKNSSNATITYQNRYGIATHNRHSGVIENFVVHFKDDWYVGQYAGAVTYINWGIIRNGYVYGNPIKYVPKEYMDATQQSQANYIGAIASVNRVGGTIENCFTVMDIYSSMPYRTSDSMTFFVGSNRGMVRNCFSSGSVYYKESYGDGYIIKNSVSPLYTNASSGGIPEEKNMYLYSGESYDKTTLADILLEKAALHDTEWYDELLNDASATTKAGEMDTNPVRQGFYPHVNMAAGMPEQPWLLLPELSDFDRPEILYTEVVEQGMDYAIGELTLYNPGKTPVQFVSIEHFASENVEILNQYDAEDFWHVRIRVSKPEKCFSEYNIKGFEMGSARDLISYSRYYSEYEYKKIGFEFYHAISNISDWIKINDDRSQNYRLYNDIDFAYYPMEAIYIGNGKAPVAHAASNWATYAYNFTGTFDGNGKTISNLDLRQYGGLFESLYGGTVKNLTVKNVDISALDPEKPVSLRRAVIRTIGKDSVVENVHVLGVTITGTEVSGGLVGMMHAGRNTIVNCSVHDATITTTSKNNGNTQYIGGIAGIGSGDVIISITNSYVDGLHITARDASDVGGIGGIVGRVTSGCTLENLYVADTVIDSFFQYTGGVAGSIINQTYSDGYVLQNVYIDADISSVSDLMGGLVAYSQPANQAEKVNALFLGNIFMRNEEFNYVSRYIGFQTATTNLVKDGLYTFKEASYVNGRLNNEDRDDTDTRNKKDPYVYLTREMLCNPEFYTNGIKVDGVYRNLDIGESFALTYEVTDGAGAVIGTTTYAENEQLPWLRTADGTGVLPYQKFHTFEETDVQITKITAAANPSNAELFEVKVTVSHPENYNVEALRFDSNVSISSGPQITKNGTTESVIAYEVLAQGYVDRYYITGIDGKVNETEDLQISLNLDSLIPALFLDINNADDWNSKMVQHGQKGYNIRINGNLDFTGQSDYQENVIVNRVLGGFVEETNWVKITGINRATNYPLIDTAYGRISNIKFENIELEKLDRTKTRNFGIIGHAAGNVSNVRFTDIVIDSSYRDEYTAGRHGGGYTNNVALISMLSGAASNVKIDGVYVQADATGVTSTNTTSAFVGYSNSTASFNNIEAKNISILSGDRYYTGGIVGYMNGATKLTGITLTDFAIFANVDAGGVAGYAAATTYGRTMNNIIVKDGFMIGRVRVGGVIGQGYLVNSTDASPSVVDNVFVMGDYHVGGVAGIGGASRNVTVKNSDIYGNYRVGGIVGYGNALATHVVDSTVSSAWARTDSATTNDLYQAAVTARKNAVEEKLSDASLGDFERRTLENAQTYLDILLLTSNKGIDWRYQMWNKYSGTPSANKIDQDAQIGGISGMGQLFENNVVTNCTIGSITAEEVGGIVGHHVNIGYDTWSRTARVFSNACTESTVTGAKNVGGIIGIAKRYTSSNNYSNATVSAVAPSKVDITDEGTNAGGIIGCINKTATYALSETPRVYSCYFAGTVSANDYVGGIIGRCYQDVYGDNRDLMMTGTVCVTSDIVNPHIQLIANRISNPTGVFLESVVYKDAKLVYGTAQREQTAEQYYNGTEADGATGLTPEQQKHADNVSVVSTSDLKNIDFWSKKSGGVQVGFTTTPTYWKFDGLTNGFMPYVTYRLYYGDNEAGNSLVRYQEGFAVDANGVKTYNYKTYKGGVPIPGFVSGRSLMMMRRPVVQEVELPTMTAYCVDADKLNLEFSSVNPAASYVVAANGKTIAEGTVSGRVVTLQYDYKTTLLVTVTDGEEECEYRINAVDVSRNITVSGDEYFYITGNGVEGSRATISGNFVNLYKGKALTVDGMLYDVTTGNLMGKAKGNGVAETVVPLAQFTYDGYKIELYHGFTVSAGMERNNKRLYVKDNTLFAIDSALSKEADAVILETGVGLGELTAILEHGGSIAELTGETFCFPKEFVNNKIAQMTNNLDTDASIVLVRYKDGGVMGFDYLSGETLFRILREGTGNAQGGNSATGSSLITNASDSYKEIQAFESGLIASGWSPVNGTSAANGTSGSLTGNTSVPENGSDANGDALGGGSGSTSGDTKTEGGVTGDGTNEVSGDATQSGSHTGDGTNVDSGDGVSSSGGGQTSGTEQTGVTPAVTNTPGAETGVQNGKTEVSDSSSSDVSGDALQTDKNGTAGIDGIPGPTGSTGGGSVTGAEEAFQNQYSEVRGNGSVYGGGSEEKKYVPFFDSELNEYVLFDEAELLAVADTSLTSMNEKVKLSGHMIDRYIPYMNDVSQMDDDDRNGMVLMFLTIAGVAILLGILIYKHQNGGKANEED